MGDAKGARRAGLCRCLSAARYLLPVLLQFLVFIEAHGQADTTPDYLAPLSAGRRALVLGNENYLHVKPVKNAVNDADAMETQLQQLGFAVVKRLNTQRSELFTAVDDLNEQVNEGDIVAVFYAGHGLESEHNNYLLPVEAREWPASRVPFETLPTSYLLETLMSKRPAAVVLILDACREKPFTDETRGPDEIGGLASEKARTGVLIAFAAAPGSVAWSGTAHKPSSNSIYTTALIKHIRTPSAQIESIFKQVRSAVLAASGDRQHPWESTSLLGDIVLMPKAEDLERDKRVWIDTLQTGNRSIIAEFPRQFPTSQYAGTARKWLQNESGRTPVDDFETSVWAGNVKSPAMIPGASNELLGYQQNGALPDKLNSAIAQLLRSLRALRQSDQDRFVWQLDVALPKCAQARCAGGFTPRQLAWMNALRLRSAIAKQSTENKSIVIRVPAEQSGTTRDAIAVTSTVEATP